MVKDQRALVYGEMPGDVREYSRTKVFTETSVPAGLRSNHALNKDTWGLLQVKTGGLRYYLEETGTETELSEGQSLVIQPESLHHVSTSGPVTFDIVFFRRDKR